MKSYITCILLSLVLLSFVTGCQKKDADDSEDAAEVEVKELKTYDDLTAIEDLLLGLPVRLKYDDETQHLFIQDLANWGVIEIDDSSNVVNKFGRRGRGPGEIQALADFFITKEHLFIVDWGQYLIHKYNLTDGEHISSLDYGKFLLKEEPTSDNEIPPPPPLPLNDNNNQPFVTLNETILLPSQANGKFLYQAINWNGDKLADIGEIPTGCTASENKEEIRSALENRNVPARDSCLAFPVNDRSNPEEIYLVYSAIPKIAKYSLSGRKLWEHKISRTPEVDSLMIDLSNVTKSHPDHRLSQMPVRKYIAGRSSPDGDLYLITYTNLVTPQTPRRSMWVHQFDIRGTLVNRYNIVSDDVDLNYFPGIDFKKQRIFAPVYRGTDIRIYDF